MKERSKAERIELRKRKRRFLAFIIAMLIGCLPTATAFADNIDLSNCTAEDYQDRIAGTVGNDINFDEHILWKTPHIEGEGALMSGGIKGKYIYKIDGRVVEDEFTQPGSEPTDHIVLNKNVENFRCWRVKSATLDQVYDAGYGGVQGWLKIQLEAILSQYNITYVVDQEKGRNHLDNPDTYQTREGTVIQDAIPNAYFSFDGWYDNPNFTEKKITRIGEDAYGDKTLYAKFTGNSYNITYELNGGSNPDSNPATYNYGDGVDSFADALPPEGYNFVGWFEDSDFKTPITKIATDRHGDVTLYAKYESEQPGPAWSRTRAHAGR